MFKQLCYLTGLISIMVMIHATLSGFCLKKTTPLIKKPIYKWLRLLFTMTSVLLIHYLEASVFAMFYYINNALPDMETSMYFSLASYATVGYGDVLLPESFRLIGAAEGLIGTLMVSWTVAILVNYFNNK